MFDFLDDTILDSIEEQVGIEALEVTSIENTTEIDSELDMGKSCFDSDSLDDTNQYDNVLESSGCSVSACSGTCMATCSATCANNCYNSCLSTYTN